MPNWLPHLQARLRLLDEISIRCTLFLFHSIITETSLMIREAEFYNYDIENRTYARPFSGYVWVGISMVVFTLLFQ